MKLNKFFRKSDLLCSKGDVDPNGKDFYLFYKLAQLVPATWTDKDGNTIPMTFFGSSILLGDWKKVEREYFHNYSGNKETSVICDEIYEDDNFKDDTSDTWYKTYISILANDIAMRYMENWCRLWYAINEKYRPLDNVDGVETTKAGSNGYKRKVTTEGYNTSKQDAVTSSGSNGVYGFNSSSSVPANTSSSTTTPANTVNDNSVTGMPTDQHIIDRDKHTISEELEGNLINERHGNIGVTKSQDLLEAEFEFRKNYNFYKQVFNDIDEILTCHIYNEEN